MDRCPAGILPRLAAGWLVAARGDLGVVERVDRARAAGSRR